MAKSNQKSQKVNSKKLNPELLISKSDQEINDQIFQELEKIEIELSQTPKTPQIRKVAIYPGIYPAPIKTNPNRWIANYRLNKKTVKIGFFNSSDEAIAAKKIIMAQLEELKK